MATVPSGRRVVSALLLGLLATMLLGVGSALAVPADGSGNKFVVSFEDLGIEIDCDGEMIWLDAVGWFQEREFLQEGNRNLALTVFHLSLTYYNAEGETFTYMDVGPDHVFVDGEGNIVVSIVGRPGNAGGQGESLRGRMVIDPETGDVISVHGNLQPTDTDLACAALT
jgi:hypothetical protein